MNQSKNRILIFLVVFLLLTNIAMLLYFTVYDKPSLKASHTEKRGPGITAFLQNDLGFSKEQMARLDSLKKQHRNAIKPLFTELGKSKDNFYQLIGKPGIDEAALKTASDEIGKRQAALDLQFFQNFTSIRRLCTDQQLVKFDSVMPSLATKMMQPWQKNNSPKKKDSTETKN
ncbi:MAG: periplasmic heavy metal sensor [Chitinophagaceae bacterium]